MLKLVIEFSKRSFLPELRAYEDYFVRNGFDVTIAERGGYLASEFDAVLLFHGFHPFWRKYPPFVIGEYHSLSVGRLNRFKDFIKRFLNVRADFNVFLNDDVRRYFWFLDSARCAYRPMGFYAAIPDGGILLKKDYDVVYAGSIRAGVSEAVLYLAELGMKVAVVGDELDAGHPNVIHFGRVDTIRCCAIMSRARFGLNITPDEFPLNIQDSTKVIEYCALGLGVITNRYRWVDDFEFSRSAKFLDIAKVFTKNDVIGFDFVVPDVSDLEWSALMGRSGIAECVRQIMLDGRG